MSSADPRSTRMSRDVCAGLFLLAIAAFGYAGSIDLPSIWAGVGPGLLPKLVAGLIAVLGFADHRFRRAAIGRTASEGSIARPTVRARWRNRLCGDHSHAGAGGGGPADLDYCGAS